MAFRPNNLLGAYVYSKVEEHAKHNTQPRYTRSREIQDIVSLFRQLPFHHSSVPLPTRFSRLPLELRTMIYEEALTSRKPIRISQIVYHLEGFLGRRGPQFENMPKGFENVLLRAQDADFDIDEVYRVFYSSNEFRFPGPYTSPCLLSLGRNWASHLCEPSIGPEDAVRSVTLDAHNEPFLPWAHVLARIEASGPPRVIPSRVLPNEELTAFEMDFDRSVGHLLEFQKLRNLRVNFMVGFWSGIRSPVMIKSWEQQLLSLVEFSAMRPDVRITVAVQTIAQLTLRMAVKGERLNLYREQLGLALNCRDRLQLMLPRDWKIQLDFLMEIEEVKQAMQDL